MQRMIGPSWNMHRVKIDGEFGPQQWNDLLLSLDFWATLEEETILLFQADCVALRPLEQRFLKYDFIGAPCGRLDWFQFDMNGGLSIRKRSMMLKALRHYGDFARLAESTPPFLPEDVFFSRALKLLDARLPDYATARAFSIESEITAGTECPFGIHGTDKPYSSDEFAAEMVRRAEPPLPVPLEKDAPDGFWLQDTKVVS